MRFAFEAGLSSSSAERRGRDRAVLNGIVEAPSIGILISGGNVAPTVR